MTEREPEDLSQSERAALATFAVPPPPAGLADRVLDARQRRAARATRRLVAGALVAAVLLLVAGRLWWPRPALSGSVVAAARTTLQLGTRGVAVAEPGAQLRYRIERDGRGRVEQERGAVRYRIRPGGPFTVTTPAGEVQVVGTSFQVELATMEKTTRTALILAFTTLTLTVYEGRVLLGNRHGSVAVAAGEQATSTAGAPPALLDDGAKKTAPAPAAVAQAAAAPARAAERERLLSRIAAARSQRQEAPGRAQGQTQASLTGNLDKDYVRGQMREIIPLVKECYENALEKSPDLGGRIMMKFTISGEPDIGGLVESAEVEEVTGNLNDPGLLECMRESMYALRFKPPQGGGEVVVSYPFVLKAASEDAPEKHR